MLLIKPLLAFRPNKMDWIFASKTFAAGLLALYVAFELNLAYPIWAIGTVFVIANPYSGMTSSKSIYRVLGTLIGAIVSVIATPALMNTPWLFTLFLAAWVGWCLYLSLLDRTPRSYVFMLAGYTTVIIAYNAVYYIDTVSIFDMAVGRFLEITVGVVCSAIVTTTVFPMHIGPAVKVQVNKTFQDTQKIFNQILLEEKHQNDYAQSLGNLARDIADIHVMAVHLSYEKSTLKGMTKPLQEMLHQMTMLLSNLVAMSERMNQLSQCSKDERFQHKIMLLHEHIYAFIKDYREIQESDLNLLPAEFDADFEALIQSAAQDQRTVLAGLKMDIRHFIQNIRAIKLIWQRINHGDASLPEAVTPLTTNYPNLHRDHGVAVRGGISAFFIILIATGFWILSGWKAGFMMAEMAAISACILTSLDNPVPALKMFIRANIYAAVAVFIYAYGIFPHVTEFWQLGLVLAPFVMYCLMLFLHPPLVGIGLPLLMGTVMGLNLQNRFNLDQIMFFDASIGTVIGPIISVYVIHLVRAMSPEITVQRILSLHYKAIRQALYIPYGVAFRIHLSSMLDRIGILNSKAVQSESLKHKINLALIEASAAVDLTRLQELMQKLPEQAGALEQLETLMQLLDDYFRAKELQQPEHTLQADILQAIALLMQQSSELENAELAQRLRISLNNIRSSLCHAPADVSEPACVTAGVQHG
ncbi:FUSC family protein [Acinetobacter sp. ANC 3813]|uniref:FUSC family protein n=1 Tax=Acinetobacter sp. ANC 3813 TaxID=1977873 RepID=UPI000A34F3C5|nr:FUSC family protein [Acinetobacter sp. ANC 3813]OTG89757.1 fusaric acid resistance protein [Acinetobacter sp. ANC 3813]